MSFKQIFDFATDSDCLSAFQLYTSLILMARSTMFCEYNCKFRNIDSERDALRLAERNMRNLASTRKFTRIISKPFVRHEADGAFVSFKIVVIWI